MDKVSVCALPAMIGNVSALLSLVKIFIKPFISFLSLSMLFAEIFFCQKVVIAPQSPSYGGSLRQKGIHVPRYSGSEKPTIFFIFLTMPESVFESVFSSV